MLARYTTENDSYYGSLLHLQRATGESRFPLYDEIGSARGLVDAGGTVTDTYDPSTSLRAGMDTFGSLLSSTGATPNPYRFGAAWGYITDPSGLLQLGARFYWPEVGRFVSQDPQKDGGDWYAYVADNPLIQIDPEGLRGSAQHCENLRKTIRKLVRQIEDEGKKELCHGRGGLNELVWRIGHECADHRYDATYRKDCTEPEEPRRCPPMPLGPGPRPPNLLPSPFGGEILPK